MIVYPPGYPTKELDCDFGRVMPGSIRAFTVKVWPKERAEKSLNEWGMIVLLPDDEALEVQLDYESIVRAMVEFVIDGGDKYMVSPLRSDLPESFSRTTPILSFDPRRVEEGILVPVWIAVRREDMC